MKKSEEFAQQSSNGIESLKSFEGYYTEEQICPILGFKPSVLRRYYRSKPHKLPPMIKVGTKLLFNAEDFKKYLDAQESIGTTKKIVWRKQS